MKKITNIIKVTCALLLLCSGGCTSDNQDSGGAQGSDKDSNVTKAEPLYKSYRGLVMAGYQGWFNTPNDGMSLNWTHYAGKGGEFKPETCSIDFWPDMSEYSKSYLTEFQYENGDYASVYSSADYSTTDLHFKWMQEYGIDGAFLQRFLGPVIDNSNIKAHRDNVAKNVKRAAEQHGRAWCMMYDLSGITAERLQLLKGDWEEMCNLLSIGNVEKSPNYLYHNGKPLLVLWGAGFKDKEEDGYFTSADLMSVIEEINADDQYSIMLGVPFNWRLQVGDATADEMFHTLIKSCDIIMPWAVGRFNDDGYGATYGDQILPDDIAWCEANGVDYAPLVFPGFSWGNLHDDYSLYDKNPRKSGNFMWRQIWRANECGAKMLYVAMFDEVDEGTAILKMLRRSEVPKNGAGSFVGIDDELQSDHYLWLTGEAHKLINGVGGYSAVQPTRD